MRRARTHAADAETLFPVRRRNEPPRPSGRAISRRLDLLAGVSALSFVAALMCAPPASADQASGSRAQDVARSLQNLGRAEAEIRAQLAGRDVLRALRQMRSLRVVDGLASAANPDGGLKVHQQIGTAPGIVWEGAELPVETRHTDGNGTLTGVDVDIQQTASKAILTWERFDVGALTTVDFRQQSQDWSVLNRVMDPHQNPSYILGKITAPGQVLIINRNGILFAGSSQVNVGGLVASSLDIGLPYQTIAQRNDYFLAAGDGTRSFSFALRDDDGNVSGTAYDTAVAGGNSKTFVPQAEAIEGDVEVDPGAMISTTALSNENPWLGRVVLAAPRVINHGTIETPDGQAILIGARNFTLISNDADVIGSLQGALTTLSNGTVVETRADIAVRGLSVDSDLRGAQVLAGADDYFTVGKPVGDAVVGAAGYSSDDYAVGWNVRDERTGIRGPLVDMPGAWTFDAGTRPVVGRFSVENSGLVASPRGNITVTAQDIALSSWDGVPGFGENGEAGTQYGVFAVTTAVDANGSIYLDGRSVPYVSIPAGGGARTTGEDAGAITLQSGTVAALLPDDLSNSGAKTLPSDATSSAGFRSPVMRLSFDPSGSSNLPDAGTITLQSGSLIEAPSADVFFAARLPVVDVGTGRLQDPQVAADIVVSEGAEIDVSGMMDVQLAMESNVVHIARVGNSDLADSPLQRDGLLFGQEVYVDRRLTGVRDDGTTWYGSPLLDAQGYIDAYGRTPSELLTGGGTVSFSGVARVESGASISLAGGYKQYADGVISTTLLRTASGAIVDIGSADPNIVYSGFADQFVVTHGRWNRTQRFGTFASRLGSHFEAGYVEGGDAGTISFAGAADIAADTLHATAESGRYQRAGSGVYASGPARGGRLDLSGLLGRPTITIFSGADEDDPTLSAWEEQDWSTETLETAGFADVVMGGTGSTVHVSAGAELDLPDGGTLSLRGEDVDIRGDITAHGGKVSVALSAYDPTPGTFGDGDGSTFTRSRQTALTVHQGSVIDVGGRWVDDTGATPDTLTGSDFIDAGSILFTDDGYADRGNIPDFASIVVEAGSRLDLNGGGYVGIGGQLASAGGVGKGRGGNLSILLHPAPASDTHSPIDEQSTRPSLIYLPGGDPGSNTDAARALIDDTVSLDGDIEAFGLEGGGTFALRAPEVDIVTGVPGQTIGGTGGKIAIPTGFFEEHGFGDFQITGLLRAGVDDGATIQLQQRQWIPRTGFATASNIAQAAVIGLQPDGLRAATSFSLQGLGWTEYSVVGVKSFSDPSQRSYYADNALTIGRNVSILGDPGTTIALAAVGQLTIGSGTTIVTHGGTISIEQAVGRSRDYSSSGTDAFYYNDSVFLGGASGGLPGAVLDVSGVFVPDPTQLAWRDGEVLAGGTVVVDAGGGFIGQTGSTIDVSGTTGLVDLPPSSGSGLLAGRVPTTIGSDAGTIELTVGGGVGGILETTLVGQPGLAGGGNHGGTLVVAAPAITVVQDATSFSSTAQPASSVTGFPTNGQLVFAAASLDGTGIDGLSLSAGSLGIIAFSGTPTLRMGRSLDLAAASYRWLQEGKITAGGTFPTGSQLPTDAGTVTLAAPYLRIGGLSDEQRGQFTSFPVPADIPTVGDVRRGPTLALSGGTIDVQGFVSLQNFGLTTLASAGDVRFTSGVVSDAGSPNWLAALYTGGDIDVVAAQVYPATGVKAVLQSVANTGTITVRSNGADAPVPLSAGGDLTLSARTIVQEGVIRAPFGNIRLGLTDVARLDSDLRLRDFRGSVKYVATKNVTVAAGSLTSVSAEGESIPYGTTTNNGQDWQFAGATPSLEKAIEIESTDASAVAAGATVDLSGGGDLYATEFIPGLGGSRDLRTESRTGGGTVWAIVPGVQPYAAPEGDGTSSGDVGRTITILADIPGGPAAGTYTLLPGWYATQPGAFLVQSAGSSIDPVRWAVSRAPDGTWTVAAVTRTGTGSIAGLRLESWSVMTPATWSLYSEVASTSGNAYFAAQAAAAGTVAAALPRDAGRLSLRVGGTLALDGTPLFATGEAGRGGEVDIGVGKIAVVSDGGSTTDGLDGYLVLTPEKIAGLNAETVTLGAVQTTESTGDRLEVLATDVVVRTTSADPLVGAEFVLAASRRVSVEAGSVVRAEGADRGAGRDLLVGRQAVTDAFGTVTRPALSGDAAVLRVSTGGTVAIDRDNVPASPAASVEIGNGATVASAGALTFDSTSETKIDATALVQGRFVDIASSHIDILPTGAGAGTNLGEAALQRLLATAETLSLRARTALAFHDTVDISAAQLARLTIDAPSVVWAGAGAGEVRLGADTVTLTDTAGTSAAAPAAGTGVLRVDARRVVVTGADKVLDGFSDVTLAGGEAVSFGDGGLTGTLLLPGSLTLDAPQLVAATGGSQTVTAAGTITAINGSGAAAPATDDIGGKLVLEGAGISLDTTIAAVAGIFQAHATGPDGIELGADGRILAHGYTQTFVDHDEMLAGGSVLLQADHGSVGTAAGALIDVSAVAGGNAGALTVRLGDATGSFGLGATFRGGADAGLEGGAFVLDSAGVATLDPVAAKMQAAGFTRQFAVRSGSGDLSLGTSVKAREVALVADAGQVVIGADTTIDASGATGGRIDLYGTGGVTLGAGSTLLAKVDGSTPAADETPRGGQVNIGTGDGDLDLRTGSTIDVSGGSAYGSSGGTIHLRTPVTRVSGATLDSTLTGQTQVVFEPYTRIDIGGGIASGAEWTAVVTQFDDAFTGFTFTKDGWKVQRGLELWSAGDVTIADSNTANQLQIDLSGLRRDGQPGWLTIRAAGDLTIDASISDGFSNATAAGELATVSYADAMAGNVPGSWSYRFAAGSRTGSADPLAVVTDTGAGDFEFGDRTWNPSSRSKPLGRNDILRTGTGSIEIAAAGDVEYVNPASVIYTAGVGVDWATIPGFVDLPTQLTQNLNDIRALYNAYRAQGGYALNPTLAGLVATTPVLPTAGGDIRISAGGDIVGRQNVTDVSGALTGYSLTAVDRARYVGQVFTPWLYFQGVGSVTPDASGVFGGSGGTSSTAPAATQTAAWVRTGMFQQGIAALGGGDVTLRAGGDVRDVSVSVVSTYVVSGGKSAGEATTMRRFGGGNLAIVAGGDLSSSIVYVGDGRGDIRLGGALSSGWELPTVTALFTAGTPIPLASTLAFGDATISVAARGEIDVGRVTSDSLLGSSVTGSGGYDLDLEYTGSGTIASRATRPTLSPYGEDNVLRLASTSGGVSLKQNQFAPTAYGGQAAFVATGTPPTELNYLPPTVEMIAARGDITLRNNTVLAPSPTGNLTLLAQGSVRYALSSENTAAATANLGFLSMLDIDPGVLANPLDPNDLLSGFLQYYGRGYQLDNEVVSSNRGGIDRFTLHAGPDPLHADDLEPARIIALEGDIVSGRGLATDPVEGVGVGTAMSIFLDKPAEIYAGGDIVNMTFTGQNNRDSDVTSIIAGGDITYAIETLLTPVLGADPVLVPAGGSYTIGGPGTFVLDAGGDLDIRPSTPTITVLNGTNLNTVLPQRQYGVLSVGNRIDPYGPAQSADIQLWFGDGPGKDIAAFVDRYVDPANAGAVERNYIDELVDYMTTRAEALAGGAEIDPPTPEEALAEFRALPEREQLAFVGRIYFEELRSIVPSPDSAFTQNQRRGYEAIATLFPASLGYTDQLAASTARVHTGNLNMTQALVRTDHDSSITIVGPGGDVEVGGFTVDDTLPLNYQGIFTLRGGSIDAYLDGDFNVNSSRVITALGGDITIFTADGDIDAGRGKKTASYSPPIDPAYLDDTQAFVDFGGVITGSGIATLVTLPGGSAGDVYLIAPRGTVDAGEAGIRSSGNLAILATQVLNATNIQVGGASVGLPQASSAPVGALLGASSSQSEIGGKALADLATAAGRPQTDSVPSIITVEVLSFGE